MTVEPLNLRREVRSRGSAMDIADFCDLWGASARRRICGYSSVWMALSSRKRIAPSLLVSAITKRTRPCLEVSA